MIPLILWLTAHVIAILTGGFLAIQLVLRRRINWAVLAASGALAGFYLLLAADLLRASLFQSIGDGVLVLNALVLTLTFAAMGAQLWGCRRLLQDGSKSWQRPGLAMLLLCQLGAIVGTGWRLQDQIAASAGEDASVDVELTEITGEALLTDKQRLIPLFQAQLVGDLQPQLELSNLVYPRHCIQRAGADPTSNCHGWIFTGGQYCVKDEGVQLILEDNGYQAVDQPRPGDLIVYRNQANQIIHTGLVRAAFENGQVLVESKWGIAGRYLHLAQEQYYSPVFAYYRRDRALGNLAGDEQHLVQAVKVLPGNQYLLPGSEKALVGPFPPSKPPLIDDGGDPATRNNAAIGAE